MSSLKPRGGKLYAKIKDVKGKWVRLATGIDVGNEQAAWRWVREREREVEDAKAGKLPPDQLTVTAWADRWIDDRKALGLDWRKDRGILDNYILPAIGRELVVDVRTRHLAEMVAKIRTSPMPGGDAPPSQRTVYNIYATASALFRDAKIADIIAQSPCCLTAHQLGPKVDKDPEWRASAVFTRDETETIISTNKIPHDRRVAYALELLAGLRPGESSALRWRNYTADKQPLGELLVARSHSTKRNATKGTKTESVRYVPVHPTLAAILAEWKLSGWAAMVGRAPEPDDLIVPMPPADAAARTQRAESEPHRTYYYSGRRWREEDLPALGWRHRRHYDMRATFITLALDDGADEHIIETRVTHTKPGRGAFAGYNRGRQWERVCAEVARLKIVRRDIKPENVIQMAAVAGDRPRGPSKVQSSKSPTKPATSGLRRRVSNGLLVVVGDTGRQGSRDDAPLGRHEEAPVIGRLDQTVVHRCACDLGLAALQAASG